MTHSDKLEVRASKAESMKIKDLPKVDRPREKLERYRPQGLLT